MDLFTRARKLGIQTEFVDGQGHRHVTDAAALKIILDALPVRPPYRFLREAVVIRSAAPRAPSSNPPPNYRCTGRSPGVPGSSRRDKQVIARATPAIAPSSGRTVCPKVLIDCI
jgi:hypothetical protein